MTNPTEAEIKAATDTPAGQLARQLYGLGAVRRELGKAAGRELVSHGFTALLLIRQRGACRVSDVATDLQVDLSVASRQIAALVAAGQLERRQDPVDGRAHLLHLTDEGLAALRRAHLQMVGVLDDALSDWDPAEVEALADGLGRLTAAFAAPDPSGAPRTTPEEAAA